MRMRFVWAMIEMTCHVNHFFGRWQWCNFTGIEALDFSCIRFTRQPAIGEVFLVVANTRTKSIQKQIKSIDVDKVESKKPLASKSCLINGLLISRFNLQAGETECTLGCRGNFFLIDTDGSDLWSQGRLNAAVSAFLLIKWYMTSRFPFPFFFFFFFFCSVVFSNYRKRQKITKSCSNQDVWLDVALARLSPFWTKIQK